MRRRVLVVKDKRPMRIPAAEKIAARIPPMEECPRCRGLGKRGYLKGHKPDCKCVSCQPCKDCNGTGRVKGEPRGKRVKGVEVGTEDRRELEFDHEDDGGEETGGELPRL